MNKNILSTQPYKGSRDFYPEDMEIRDYIFSTWRKVCKSFGYEEYDGPLLEDFAIYAAKSGEEIVNNQLYSFTDRGGRKVAIRPEMTPTVARMVAQRFKTLHMPVRWFSIPNLWRYENPQKGRLREHYQLNADIFGEEGVAADFEILSIALEIMKSFGATKDMFEIRVNNRRLMEDVYNVLGIPQDSKIRVTKAIDRKNKLSDTDFIKLLEQDAKLDTPMINKLNDYLENPFPTINKIYDKSVGAKEIKDLLEMAEIQGSADLVKYDPGTMRGFDYYTGNIFEQFDLNPDNNRSMYGGGRYDNLVETFINTKIPGVGLGMGDVTMKLFLENWELLQDTKEPAKYLVTVWPSESKDYYNNALKTATIIRKKGIKTVMWMDKTTPLAKQLKYADRKGYANALIAGETETNEGTVTIKNLKTQEQVTKSMEDFISSL